MHTFLKFSLALIINNSTTMDDIDKALQSLQLQDKPNIAATAKEHHVNRSTLSRRFYGVTQSHAFKSQNQGLLLQAQEKALVLYINKLTDSGIPPTLAMVRNFVKDIASRWPRRSWSQRFCKRWKEVLESRYLTTYDSLRYKADSAWSYRLYFKMVEQKIKGYDVQAYNIYNIDEKGFLISFLTKAKRVYTKSAFSQKRLLGALQDGNRKWITCIATICGDGTSLLPSLIYKAKTSDIQDS